MGHLKDTDSAFILLPPGRAAPPSSQALGLLKDEILDEYGPDHFITSFSSLGSKQGCVRRGFERCTGQ